MPREAQGTEMGQHRRILVWLAIATSLLATVALFALVVIVSYEVLHGDEPDSVVSQLEPVRIVGTEHTVFDWPRDHCATRDYPDLPARAFKDAAGRVQLIASHVVTRRFVGSGFNRLSHPCDVTMRSRRNSDPSKFDDLEWLASPYTEDGQTVYALVHNEYQGHRHAGRCPSGDYQSCWYNAITLAVSHDGGDTFRDARPPPDHLVASVPYRYVPDQGPYGIFNPSNVLLNREDGYYYVLARAEAYRRQEARLLPLAHKASRQSSFVARMGWVRLQGQICQPV